MNLDVSRVWHVLSLTCERSSKDGPARQFEVLEINALFRQYAARFEVRAGKKQAQV